MNYQSVIILVLCLTSFLNWETAQNYKQKYLEVQNQQISMDQKSKDPNYYDKRIANEYAKNVYEKAFQLGQISGVDVSSVFIKVDPTYRQPALISGCTLRNKKVAIELVINPSIIQHRNNEQSEFFMVEQVVNCLKYVSPKQPVNFI